MIIIFYLINGKDLPLGRLIRLYGLNHSLPFVGLLRG
jgi:hypothetical protein